MSKRFYRSLGTSKLRWAEWKYEEMRGAGSVEEKS